MQLAATTHINGVPTQSVTLLDQLTASAVQLQHGKKDGCITQRAQARQPELCHNMTGGVMKKPPCGFTCPCVTSTRTSSAFTDTNSNQPAQPMTQTAQFKLYVVSLLQVHSCIRVRAAPRSHCSKIGHTPKPGARQTSTHVRHNFSAAQSAEHTLGPTTPHPRVLDLHFANSASCEHTLPTKHTTSRSTAPAIVQCFAVQWCLLLGLLAQLFQLHVDCILHWPPLWQCCHWRAIAACCQHALLQGSKLIIHCPALKLLRNNTRDGTAGIARLVSVRMEAHALQASPLAGPAKPTAMVMQALPPVPICPRCPTAAPHAAVLTLRITADEATD